MKKLIRIQVTDSMRATMRERRETIFGELETLRFSKKCAIADFGRKERALTSEALDIKKALAIGFDEKELDVEIRKHADSLLVDVVRVDTGELLETRPMTDEERQEELFAAKREKGPVTAKCGRRAKQYGVD